MNRKIRTKATFENGLLKPSEPIGLCSGEEVELIVLRELSEVEEDINDSDLMDLASKNPSFVFLKNDKEDIYSIKDLKKRYK